MHQHHDGSLLFAENIAHLLHGWTRTSDKRAVGCLSGPTTYLAPALQGVAHNYTSELRKPAGNLKCTVFFVWHLLEPNPSVINVWVVDGVANGCFFV